MTEGKSTNEKGVSRPQDKSKVEDNTSSNDTSMDMKRQEETKSIMDVSNTIQSLSSDTGTIDNNQSNSKSDITDKKKEDLDSSLEKNQMNIKSVENIIDANIDEISDKNNEIGTSFENMNGSNKDDVIIKINHEKAGEISISNDTISTDHIQISLNGNNQDKVQENITSTNTCATNIDDNKNKALKELGSGKVNNDIKSNNKEEDNITVLNNQNVEKIDVDKEEMNALHHTVDESNIITANAKEMESKVDTNKEEKNKVMNENIATDATLKMEVDDHNEMADDIVYEAKPIIQTNNVDNTDAMHEKKHDEKSYRNKENKAINGQTVEKMNVDDTDDNTTNVTDNTIDEPKAPIQNEDINDNQKEKYKGIDLSRLVSQIEERNLLGLELKRNKTVTDASSNTAVGQDVGQFGHFAQTNKRNEPNATTSLENNKLATNSMLSNYSSMLLPIRARNASFGCSPTMNLLRSMLPQSLATITQQQQHSHKKRRLSIDNTAKFLDVSSFQQKQQPLSPIDNSNVKNSITENADSAVPEEESNSKPITMSCRGRGSRNRGRQGTTSPSEKSLPFAKINNLNKEIVKNGMITNFSNENEQRLKTNLLTTEHHTLMVFASNKFRECFLCANLKNTRKSVKHACYQCVLPFCVSCFNLYHYSEMFLLGEDGDMVNLGGNDRIWFDQIEKLKKRKERSTINLANKREKLGFDYGFYKNCGDDANGDKGDDEIYEQKK